MDVSIIVRIFALKKADEMCRGGGFRIDCSLAFLLFQGVRMFYNDPTVLLTFFFYSHTFELIDNTVYIYVVCYHVLTGLQFMNAFCSVNHFSCKDSCFFSNFQILGLKLIEYFPNYEKYGKGAPLENMRKTTCHDFSVFIGLGAYDRCLYLKIL